MKYKIIYNEKDGKNKMIDNRNMRLGEAQYIAKLIRFTDYIISADVIRCKDNKRVYRVEIEN